MRKTEMLVKLLTYGGLIGASMLLGLPFFWMVMTSFKSTAEIAVYPPNWFPATLQWTNYRDAWNSAPFGRFYLNSIVVATVATTLQVTFALLMAYAFALIRFPLKPALLVCVIATMLIPDEMKLVPNFLLLSRLGWVDTYAGLIVPGIAHAFPVFVLHEQFRQLPRPLFDAAYADGAGHLKTLWHVAIPLSRPVLVAVALMSFLGQWNAYLWPLIATNSTAMRTLALGLAFLRKEAAEGSAPWNLLMAASVLIVIPILILYTVAQRAFVDGITKGALKD